MFQRSGFYIQDWWKLRRHHCPGWRHVWQQGHLVTPVSSTLQQLAVYIVGDVVTPARPLTVIVPGYYSLKIETWLENKDIIFVRPQQNTTIKVKTFRHTKYGTLTGKMQNISDDAVNEEKRGLIYSAFILQDRVFIPVEDKGIAIVPGILVMEEIKISQHRLMGYFSCPLMEYQGERFRER